MAKVVFGHRGFVPFARFIRALLMVTFLGTGVLFHAHFHSRDGRGSALMTKTALNRRATGSEICFLNAGLSIEKTIPCHMHSLGKTEP